MNTYSKTLWLLSLLFMHSMAHAVELHIVASLPALGHIAQGVAGDHAKVKILAHIEQDPHFVPPKPTLARHLARADLLIAAGLGLEIGWLPPLIDAARNDAIRVGSAAYIDGRDVLTEVLGKPQGHITRAMGDIHPEGNPHWWLDPINGVRLAQVIAKRLSKLDPEHAHDYQKNAQDFAQTIKAHMPKWQQALQQQSPLVSYHDSYIYLVQRFHLHVMNFVETKPGIEPSTAHLDALLHQLQKGHIKGLWLEPYHDGALVRKLCKLSHTPCRIMPDAMQGNGFKAYIGIFETLAAGGQ